MDIKKMDNLDGKRVTACTFPEGIYSEVLRREFKNAYLSYEFHGDHAENWIVVMEGGKEIERINTRFLESIEWGEA